ncbi:MAG TPA: hypothetical protein VF815_12790 [Myxococcaceae bacterium]|jgi:hypothetical protein
MRLRTLWIPIILSSLAGCGEDGTELEKGPFLRVDRPRLGFGLEFNSGTLIQTTGFNSLALENGGDAPLVINKISEEGDSANVFSVQLPPDITSSEPIELQSLKRTFVEVRFRPLNKQKYTGKLIIESNSAKNPRQEVELVGCGLRNTEDTLLEECKDLFLE